MALTYDARLESRCTSVFLLFRGPSGGDMVGTTPLQRSPRGGAPPHAYLLPPAAPLSPVYLDEGLCDAFCRP